MTKDELIKSIRRQRDQVQADIGNEKARALRWIEFFKLECEGHPWVSADENAAMADQMLEEYNIRMAGIERRLKPLSEKLVELVDAEDRVLQGKA